MPPPPIFFDPSGKRHRWTRRISLAVLALITFGAIAFATTIINVPAPAPLALGYERMTPLPFHGQVSRISRALSGLIPAKFKPAPAGQGGKPLTIAFYTSWTDGSAPALARNINQIDWVAPTLMTMDARGELHASDDLPMRRILASKAHHPLVIPLIQNIVGGIFTGDQTVRLLADPRRRAGLIRDIGAALDRTGDGGIIFDFENLPATSLGDYRRLLAETRKAFSSRHRIVAATLPVNNPEWSPRQFAPVADKLILMAYDQHWQGGMPGPIADNAWFADSLMHALRGLPAGKAVIALGNYAYDWHDGHADSLTVEEAWLAAHDSAELPVFDKASGNVTFSYLEGTSRHDVWMLDAATSWNQMQILRRLNTGNIALWRLGSEDPGFWRALDAWRTGRQPALARLAQETNVDVRGQGEILNIEDAPQAGQRAVTFDRASGGMITDERYLQLPTPYVVRRTGAAARQVALTFDDGPDPQWTPRILSILERYHAPATFFVVGENGVANRDILRRIARDGDEIGNHSYTHPNMADENAGGIALELNATQRLIEAETGRSTRLFRAPYFGDAEPTTADELIPALVAQRHGYTIVGLHVDPGDWKTPGASAILERTLQQAQSADPERSGNIVLLHDGGGDRSQTVAALPAIISGLRRAGYQIVTVASLAGKSHDAVMPRVGGMDLLSVKIDVGLFGVLAGLLAALNWTFFFAIGLGMARSVVMTVLALRPGKRRSPPEGGPFQPTVSVIIPAYNEEKVIADSVRRVLASDYPRLQIIVADDGSRDRTSEIVAESFGHIGHVTLLTLRNGGKSAALNRALQDATGEIIVALDADTQFEPDTIARLVRWFGDPSIGAVAGNAKVGNRINLVTRWQGIEYVTAQNLERRALDGLDAVMVVPGAVGAWRREALDDVGGFPEDTLAEDQDLTIAIQRRGWKIAYDEEAVAWTEAPETLRALAKQRFRWSYGTLQCLWKHRGLLRKGRPAGLAFVGMPQAWLFQIVFALISPAIDLALVVSILATALRVHQHGWDQTQTDVLRMAFYWLCFTSVDLACGWIACRLDVRDHRFSPGLMIAQRFAYRQIMYWVVIKAVASAMAGLGIGWGKLERTGTVNAAPEPIPSVGGEAHPDAKPRVRILEEEIAAM